MSQTNVINSNHTSKSVSEKGEEHAEKETLDFSGRGLKLDTEEDGNSFISLILKYSFSNFVMVPS